MVDFRYHLVSLISVFLALAVGIVLGAGPLREGIGDALTGQVDELRTDRDQLRQDLDAANIEVTDRDDYIATFGAAAAAGHLSGVSVALLALPDTTAEDVESAREALVAAGATISAELAVNPDWVGTELTFRQTFAGQLAGYLESDPPSDAASEYVLGAALAQMITDGSDAELIGELLVAGETPFLSTGEYSASDALVLVGPRPTPVDETLDELEPEPTIDWFPMVPAIVDALPTVTVGAGDELILAIREAALPVSTIDSVSEIPAITSIPLAVIAELGGTHGNYGSYEAADLPVPPLPSVAAAEEPPADQPDEEGTGEEEADDAEEDTP